MPKKTLPAVTTLASKPKPKKRRPAYKNVSHTAPLEDCVSGGFSALEELASEMRETFDNMDGNNMGHLEKCERAGEAADTLEGVTEIEVPDCLQGLIVAYSEGVNTRKGRYPSRDVRLANAVGMLQAARDEAENADLVEDDASERDDFINEIDNAIGEVEGVEFPGMFG